MRACLALFTLRPCRPHITLGADTARETVRAHKPRDALLTLWTSRTLLTLRAVSTLRTSRTLLALRAGRARITLRTSTAGRAARAGRTRRS